MARYIDADKIYERIAEKEELARQRVIDTPSRLPNGDFNPYATRYATQLDERTTFKFMIADAPAADVVPVAFNRFAEWVADWILRGCFEECAGGFAELACRRLEDLGIMRKEGNLWVRNEVEE